MNNYELPEHIDFFSYDISLTLDTPFGRVYEINKELWKLHIQQDATLLHTAFAYIIWGEITQILFGALTEGGDQRAVVLSGDELATLGIMREDIYAAIEGMDEATFNLYGYGDGCYPINEVICQKLKDKEDIVLQMINKGFDERRQFLSH